MSFDIEKRFRFVSSDDINDDVNEEDYQANDGITIATEEDTETKKIKERKEAVSEDLEESKNNFDDLDDNNKEEDDDEGEEE